MTAGAWLALAAAAVLVPLPAREPARVGGLAEAGRLVRPRAPGDPGAVRLSGHAGAASLAAAVVVAGAAGGVPLGVATAAVAATAWRVVATARRGRAEVRAHQALGVAVHALIAELEAGSRPDEALRAAAASGVVHAAIFDRAAGEAAAGGDAGEVLARAPATRPLGCAWRIGAQTGAPLAGVLTRVATDLDTSADQRRAVAVALAGPRASAAVLTGLPVLGLALGGSMGAHPLHFLLRTPAGSVVGCVGVLLDAAGVLWIQRILRRAAA